MLFIRGDFISSMRKYISIGVIVPEVKITLENFFKTGLRANEESKQHKDNYLLPLFLQLFELIHGYN